MELIPAFPELPELAKYSDTYVLIYENKVIAHSRDLRKFDRYIIKCKTAPIILWVPPTEIEEFAY